MVKYIVGKNDRDTNYRLKWLESFDKKKWVTDIRIGHTWAEDTLERAFHFDSAKEAKVVAKELKGFVAVIEKKWVWKSAL